MSLRGISSWWSAHAPPPPPRPPHVVAVAPQRAAATKAHSAATKLKAHAAALKARDKSSRTQSPPPPPPLATADGGTCDGSWAYRDDCAHLSATAMHGLGNQMLYVLSISVLASHLRQTTCAAGPHRCDVAMHDFYMYRRGSLLPRLREWMPGVDAAAAPCQLLYDSPGEREHATPGQRQAVGRRNVSASFVHKSDLSGNKDTGVLRYGAAAIHTGVFDRAWSHCQVEAGAAEAGAAAATTRRTDGSAAAARSASAAPPPPSTSWVVSMSFVSNFCVTTGLFRVREMPSSAFWRAMRAQAERLLRPPLDPSLTQRHADVDREGTVCIHLRGLSVEFGHEINGVQRTTKAPSRVALRAQTLQLAVALAEHRRADTLFVAAAYAELVSRDVLNRSTGVRVPSHLRLLHAGAKVVRTAEDNPRNGWNVSNPEHRQSDEVLRSTLTDLTTLAKCRVLVLEQPPARTTYARAAPLACPPPSRTAPR